MYKKYTSDIGDLSRPPCGPRGRKSRLACKRAPFWQGMPPAGVKMQAVFLIAMMLGTGSGIPPAEKHVDYVPPLPPSAEVQARAAVGDADAQYELGVAYENGVGVARDYVQAMTWFTKAAATNAKAQAELDKLTALHAQYLALKAGAEAGDAKAQYDFAVSLHGPNRAWGETDDAVWIRRSAEKGYAPAQAQTADYYYRGYLADLKQKHHAPYEADDGAANLPEAMSWYSRAAAQDDLDAEYTLSGLYALDTSFRDLDRMEYWMQKIAYRSGNAYFKPGARAFVEGKTFLDAQGELCRYYSGQGMHRTVRENDWQLMVDLGSAVDYAKLRVCYEHQAADIYAPDALLKLADMYERGLGMPVDLKKAADYYLKGIDALDQIGDGTSVMARLGLVYARGGKLESAYFWLSLVGRYQPYANEKPTLDEKNPVYGEARRALAEVTAKLTPSQRQQTDAAITRWLLAHPPKMRPPVMMIP